MIIKHLDGILVSVYIQPNASKNQIVGEHNGELKIKIQSPPVEGAANSELIEYLAKLLKISKRQIVLIKGESSRHKQVFIDNMTQESFLSSLQK